MKKISQKIKNRKILIKSFLQLWSYCSLKEKIEQILLIIFTVFSSVAKIYPILILAIITDKITTGKVDILNLHFFNSLSLLQTTVVAFLIAIFLWGIAMINCTLVENFGYKMQNKIHSIGLQYIFIPRKNSDYCLSEGEISYSIKTVADNMLSYYYLFICDIIRNIAAVILLFISVFSEGYILGLICILGTLLIALIVYIRIKLEVEINIKAEEKNGKIQNFITKTIQNIPIIINFSSHNHESNRLNYLNQKLYKQNRKKVIISYFYWIIMIAVEYSTQMMVIIASILLQSSDNLDVALIILVAGYASRISSEMEYFGGRITTIQNISIKIHNLKKIIPNKEQFMNHHKINNIENIKQIKIEEITIKNLEIEIDEKIKTYDCSFNNKEVNVISGKSGSGKTTLINAILGFKECNKGEIILNQKHLIPSFYYIQEKISVAYQNEMLFEDSIENNLLYPNGAEGKDILNLNHMIQRFKIEHLLIREQDSINILSKLSGGEKKKISLIRAMLKKSDVLIFDEPTNNLDSDSVTVFIELINNLKNNGKMVIIISHDSRILNVADNLIKI